MKKRYTIIRNESILTLAQKYGASTAMTYFVIYSHVEEKDGYACVTQPTIIKEVNISRKTFFKAIKALEDDGYILIERNNRKPNKYFFPYEKLFNEKLASQFFDTSMKEVKDEKRMD